MFIAKYYHDTKQVFVYNLAGEPVEIYGFPQLDILLNQDIEVLKHLCLRALIESGLNPNNLHYYTITPDLDGTPIKAWGSAEVIAHGPADAVVQILQAVWQHDSMLHIHLLKSHKVEVSYLDTLLEDGEDRDVTRADRGVRSISWAKHKPVLSTSFVYKSFVMGAMHGDFDLSSLKSLRAILVSADYSPHREEHTSLQDIPSRYWLAATDIDNVEMISGVLMGDNLIF